MHGLYKLFTIENTLPSTKMPVERDSFKVCFIKFQYNVLPVDCPAIWCTMALEQL